MIPPLIENLWERKHFEMLVRIFSAMAGGRKAYYLRRNRNAVERIKDEFVRVFRRPHGCGPVMSGNRHEDLARYVHHLGVKALIDDMRLAASKNNRPNSLLWFMYHKAGSSSRWELLLIDKLHREAMLEKDAYSKLFDGIKTEFQMLTVTPEWVVSAKKEWRKLADESRRLHGYQYLTCIRSMKAIEARIINAGYSMNEDEK